MTGTLTRLLARRKRLAAASLGALCVLPGCVSFLPLPVNPFEIFLKEFPTTIVGPAGDERDYTIKSDVFSFPQINFSVTRPSQANWTFVPGNNAVTLSYRNVPQGVLPPAVGFQFEQVGPGVNVNASEDKDLINAGQSTDVFIRLRSLDGVVSDTWQVDTYDPGTKLPERLVRLYTIVPGALLLTQVIASAENLQAIGTDFTKILTSVKVPQIAGATPLAPAAPSSVIAPGIQGASYVDPSTHTTLTLADQNWQFGVGAVEAQRIEIAANRPGVEAGVGSAPQLGMLAFKNTDTSFDVDKIRKGQLALLIATKTHVTIVPRTVGGAAGEVWTYAQPDVFGEASRTEQYFVKNAAASVILTGYLAPTDAVIVQPDMDKMVAGITLPSASPAALAALDISATQAAVLGMATGAASPAPAASSNPAATTGAKPAS